MPINEAYLRNLRSIFPEELLDRTMEHIKLESEPNVDQTRDEHERRRGIRVKGNGAEVKIVRHNSSKVFSPFVRANVCHLLDISVTGIAIRCGYRLKRNDTVELEIIFNDGQDPVSCKVSGTVTRMNSQGSVWLYGLAILGEMPRDLQAVVNAKVIRQKLEGEVN